MLRTWIAAIVVLAAMPTVGRAQKEPVAPKSPPPMFATVHDVDKNQNLVYLLMIEFALRQETRNVTEFVEQNGQKIPVTKVVNTMAYVPVSRVMLWDFEKAVATNGAGKKLSREDLFQQLKAGDSILIYVKDLDPVFLKPLKENAILLQMETFPALMDPMRAPKPIPAPKK
jgi:hypothetical protein